MHFLLKEALSQDTPWFLPVSGIDSPFDSVLGLLLPSLAIATPAQVTWRDRHLQDTLFQDQNYHHLILKDGATSPLLNSVGFQTLCPQFPSPILYFIYTSIFLLKVIRIVRLF